MPISLYFDAETFTSATVKCAICKSTLDWDRTTMTDWSHVSSYEVSGSNYTSGGQTVSSKTKTRSGSEWVYDCDDVTWTNVTFTDGRYYVFYYTTGGKIIGVFQSSSVLNPTGADGTFQVSTNGLFRVRAN